MIRRFLLGALALVLMLIGWSGWINRAPHDDAQIALLTDRLFTFGAIGFVHDAYDGPDAALFDCVANGHALTAEQSDQYRHAYQNFLLSRQSLFVRLDADLVLRKDFGKNAQNNVHETGIEGLHDQHDLSALNNLVDISQSLADLNTAWFPGRVQQANDIYKDLTDLMVHMAPAIHSIGLLRAEPIPEDIPPDLKSAFEHYYHGMKEAQKAVVNSTHYWAAVDTALASYARLVDAVQAEVRTTNGPLAHSFSGQWLSLQTIAPRLGPNSPGTQERRNTKADCQAAL